MSVSDRRKAYQTAVYPWTQMCFLHIAGCIA
jgi:hypothetical protein